MKSLLDRIADIPVASYVAEIKKKRSRGDQQAYGEEPALGALLVPGHLAKADRHQKCGDGCKDGQGSQMIAIDSSYLPHIPGGGGSGEEAQDCRAE